MAYVIGLNSGSSFDGIDAVLLETEIGPDGHPTRPKFIDGITFDWPEDIGKDVLRAFHNEVTLFEMCRLNYKAGAVYAEATKALLEKVHKTAEDITVIGFDGQTVYQEPPANDRHEQPKGDKFWEFWTKNLYACGTQIGEQSLVAAAANITTVSHFRPADHAFGGTGAPLMQYFDFVTFRNEGPVLTLNIGGIANCHLVDADRKKMRAFDTGPGNVMSDHAMRKFFNVGYDKDGEFASKGSVNQEMLAELMTHPFLKRTPPRCAWRLDFGAEYADSILDKYSSLKPEDILATFCDFTAACIVKSIVDNVPSYQSIKALIASGGGVRNKTVMSYLVKRLPDGMKVVTSDEFGIPPQYKEAMKFGTLGFATINQLANNIPACSGATQFTVMGKITYAPRFARNTV